MEKRIRDIAIEIDNIHKEFDADYFHDNKRIKSHLLVDTLLDECHKGQCPDLTKELRVLYCLADISLDKYIHERAYYYYRAGIGQDDQDRYYMAANRLQKVIKCSNVPNLDGYLLDLDSKEITCGNEGQATYLGARRRKAFWMYLRYKPHNNYYTDYCGACWFIDKLHGISTKSKCNKYDRDTAIELLKNHFHIATPLDLYRLCIIRKKVTSEEAEPDISLMSQHERC